MAVASSVLAGLSAVREWQEELYRDLHQHPELSHQEGRTAAQVNDRLGQVGFEVHQGVGGTGVVGMLGNGDGPVVLLRADMDAGARGDQAAVCQHRDSHGRERLPRCRWPTRAGTICTWPACSAP